MSVSSVLKGAIAQINPFDNGATYGTYNNGIHAKPPVQAPKTTTAPGLPSGTYRPDTSAFDKQMADSNAAIRALQAQLATQPRLPSYNVAAAWASAQKKAESAVNPVYTDKLNAYLAKAQLARTQQEGATATNKANIQTGLEQTIQDIGTQGTRAEEDTATTLADLVASEAFQQEQGGTAFDRARSSLLGDIASAGLTTSGLGAQAEQNAIDDRNKQEAEQGRQFQGQRDATSLGLKRTKEDLKINTERAQGSAVSRTQQEDTNLKNFIDNAALDEKDFRSDNEANRLAAVSGEVNNQYKIGVANFIQSLIGSGARAQDIALAQQVYG